MKTLSPEMDAWLERQRAKQPPPTAPDTIPLSVPKNKPAPECPLTDAQFAWLWPRYQKCRFGMISAASRLAKTPLQNLTVRGKNFAIRMAFKHRTQIFGRPARKFAQDEFLSAIRTAAAKDQVKADPKVPRERAAAIDYFMRTENLNREQATARFDEWQKNAPS